MSSYGSTARSQLRVVSTQRAQMQSTLREPPSTSAVSTAVQSVQSSKNTLRSNMSALATARKTRNAAIRDIAADI
jgi:hypothetical protein